MASLVRLYEEHGQSPWLDNLTRPSLHDGTMTDLIARGVRGVTANPTIVAKAIKSSNAYDQQLHDLLLSGLTVEEAYWELAVTDVVADKSCRVTTTVAGAGAPRPVPDEVAGENAPARHASTAPAVARTMPRVTRPPQERRGRCLVYGAASPFGSRSAVSRPRESVPLTSRRLPLVQPSPSHLTHCRCRAVPRG